MSYGGRDGGRDRDRYDRGYNGSYDGDTRGKYDRGYQSKFIRSGEGDRGRSPSPSGQKAWGGTQVKNQGGNLRKSRSRSPERLNHGPPGRSFHEMMMERARSSPPKHQQKSSAAEYGNGQSEWGKSVANTEAVGANRSYCGEEVEEEGDIPPNEHV